LLKAEERSLTNKLVMPQAKLERMKLENIGFYTLEDERAKNTSRESRLWRCEMLITSKCNFKCPYCRGTDKSADITFDEAKRMVDIWTEGRLKNIRFSGGEPTIVPWLIDLVKYTKSKGVERIAISTNGSAKRELYNDLIDAGVNDFSISLDACCASIGDMMAGNIKGSWEKVVSNIKHISSKSYVTVGVVLTEENIIDINTIIDFASNKLGVADIRIITSAQWNEPFSNVEIPSDILEKHPILKYRWINILKGRNVRGVKNKDNQKCPLMLDDMSVKGNYHYPCIIKMREGCEPIGEMRDLKSVRQSRKDFYEKHNTSCDEICKKNCLDVCVDYNNKVRELQK